MFDKFSLKATVIPCLWLLSFVGAFLLWPVAASLQVALVITMLGGLTAYAYIKADHRAHWNPVSIALVALWAVAGNSVIWSEVKHVALIYFCFFSAFPLTFFLFSRMSQTETVKLGMMALRAVGVVIFALGLINLTQFFVFPDMLKFGGTHWPFEDNNSLAAILGAGVIIALGEALRGGAGRYIYMLAAIIICAAVISTNGRALLLGLALVIPVFCWLAKPRDYKPLWGFISGVVILLATMTTAEINFFNMVQGAPQTADILLGSGLTEPNSISGHRWMIWASTIEIFKTYPWAGTGIGTFFLYYPEFREVAENSAGYQAHNDLLQFVAEMGWAAPLIALSIVFYVIIGTGRQVRQLPNGEDRLNLMIALAIFGLFVGHSLVNFNFYVLPSLMIIGLCLAIWNGYMPFQQTTMVMSRKTKEYIALGVALLFVIPLWGAHLSEYYTSRAIESLSREDIQGFAHDLNMADTWALGMNGRATLQGAKFAAATDDNNKRALALLDKAEAHHPRLVQIYIERAHLLAEDDPEKAVVEAEKAVRLDKTSLNARLVLSNVLDRVGRSDESYEVLKDGLDGKVQVSDHHAFFEALAVRALERKDFDTNKRALDKLRAPRVKRPSGFE